MLLEMSGSQTCISAGKKSRGWLSQSSKHVPLESGFPAMIQRQDKFIFVDFRMLFSSHLEAMQATRILQLVVIHFEWVQYYIRSLVFSFIYLFLYLF